MRAFLLSVVFLSGLLCLAGADWPQFRGPDAAGISKDTNLPSEWGIEKNVAWKTKVPGVGWACPVVWQDKLFVLTAESENQPKPSAGGFGGGRPGGDKGGAPKPGGEFEKDKGKGGFPGGGRMPSPPDAVYRWQVICYDRATGKQLWKQLASEHKPTIPTHRTNTYASETPVVDGERLYAYFGMNGLFCYDLAGKQIWKKDLGSYPMQFGWGTGSSPVLHGDSLFVQCDNEAKSFLVSFDKKTGQEKWRKERDEKSTWSTPYIWKNKQRTELVTNGSRNVRSYDPETGKLLWELGGFEGRCSATPIGNDELIFVGVGGGRGVGPLFAIKAGANGSLEKKGSQIAWTAEKGGPPMSSPLLLDGLLYVLEQRGLLTCYEAKTGKVTYNERIPGARNFTSSPWAYDGKIFCLDDSGTTFVVSAGPQFKVLGQNKLEEMFWSSPAIAGKELYLRGVDHLFCIRQ